MDGQLCPPADVFFYGGTIVVMDSDNSEAEALAVKDGKIVAVGTYEEIHRRQYVGPNTQMIKLVDDQTLLPGFIEPHTHAVHMVWHDCISESINGYDNPTYADVKSVITTKISNIRSSDDWCVFLGWDCELVPDLPDLSANKIDSEFCQDHDTPFPPIFIIGQNQHVAWANKRALNEANISAENPPSGFVVENSKLTGQMFELPAILSILRTIKPRPDLDRIMKATRKQWKNYASRGFTTITDLWYVSNDTINDALYAVAEEDDCPIRLALYDNTIPSVSASVNQRSGPSSCCSLQVQLEPTNTAAAALSHPLPRKFKDSKKLWVAGVKLFTDGSPHCGTMAVDCPFLSNDLTDKLGFPANDHPCGKLNYKDEELFETVKHYHDREDQPQIAIHAHGERAIKQALSVYKKVLDGDPTDKASDRRHRMEHLGLITEEQITQAEEQNLALSFFVCHLYFYGKTFSESIFGRKRTNRWAPLALAKKHKLRWTIHQDHPSFPGAPMPFANLKTAVTRTHRDDSSTVYGPEYCVDIRDAIRSYTIDAAWQLHAEEYLGSLEVGKLADLLILDKNPYQVDAMKLEEIQVVETFLEGKRTGLAELQNQRLKPK